MGCERKMNAVAVTQAHQEDYIEEKSIEYRKAAKAGGEFVDNIEDTIRGIFTAASIAEGKSWMSSIMEGRNYSNANQMVSELTAEKFKSIDLLLRDGTKDEISFVRDEGIKLMTYIASNSDAVTATQIRSNDKMTKVALNLFDYYRSTMRTQTNIWGVGGGLYIPLGGEKRIDLISNMSRTMRQYKPFNQIYQLMTETGSTASSSLPRYIYAVQALIDQFSKGDVTADIIDKYAYLTDLNQLGYQGKEAGHTRVNFEAIAKKELTNRLTREEGITDTKLIDDIWNNINEFKVQWNLLNYGYADPSDVDGKPITKADLMDAGKMSQHVFNITGKDGKKISVPPMLHTILFLGGNLAKLAEGAGNDAEAQRVLGMFGSLDNNTGFKIRQDYMPSSSDDNLTAFVPTTNPVGRLNASPEILHERDSMNKNNTRRLSDNIVNIVKSFNEYVSVRSEYIGLKAIENIINNDGDLVRDNKAMYDSVKIYTTKMLEDYTETQDKRGEIAGHVAYLKRFAYGLLGLQAGILLTGSAPTNAVAGLMSSSMDMPMFTKEGQLAMRKAYSSAQESQGLEGIVAKMVQNEYQFHRSHEKVSDMIIKDSVNNLNGAKQRMYKELGLALDDPEKKGLFGALAGKLDGIPEMMTKTGEALINKAIFLSEKYSFNASENWLLRIGEAYSFQQTNKAMTLWFESETKKRAKQKKAGEIEDSTITEEEIRRQTKNFIDEFSLDSFNLAKSSMGDFSKLTKPMWAWKTLREADTSAKVLRGALLSSMYMFKGVLPINAEVIGKIGASFVGLAKNVTNIKDMKIGTAAVGGAMGTVLGMVALGVYQMLAEFIRKDGKGDLQISLEGEKYFPTLGVIERATPYQPVIATVRMAAQGFGMMANVLGNGDVGESYGMDAAGFVSYVGGTLLGGGFRESYNKKYQDMFDAMTGVMNNIKFKMDFGYSWLESAATGLFKMPDEKDPWKYLRDMNNSLDNFVIFNRSNDVMKVGSTVLFGINQLFAYANTGDTKHLGNMQNSITNELLYQAGAFIPRKYSKKKWDDWGLKNAIWKADAADRDAAYRLKKSNRESNKYKYQLRRYIYGLKDYNKQSFYNLQLGFDRLAKGYTN